MEKGKYKELINDSKNINTEEKVWDMLAIETTKRNIEKAYKGLIEYPSDKFKNIVKIKANNKAKFFFVKNFILKAPQGTIDA